jgi:hypothetical protein
MRFKFIAKTLDDRGVERLVVQQSRDEDDLCFAVGQRRAPVDVMIGKLMSLDCLERSGGAIHTLVPTS